jgi:hypothetical protein
MLRMRWYRIPDGGAAGAGRTQDLPAALQAVLWQGPRRFGVKNSAYHVPPATFEGLDPGEPARLGQKRRVVRRLPRAENPEATLTG